MMLATLLEGVIQRDRRESNDCPVASKHGNRRSLLNDGSMALGRTTGRQRQGVGKGRDREWGVERTQGSGETGNGNRTGTGEGGEFGG